MSDIKPGDIVAISSGYPFVGLVLGRSDEENPKLSTCEVLVCIEMRSGFAYPVAATAGASASRSVFLHECRKVFD